MAEELNIDLSNYKDRVGQRVPDGRYLVVVDDVELDKSAAGNDMINVWFRIADGGDYDGAIIIDRLTQTEKALFRTVGFMQALGLPTPRKRMKVNIGQWRNRKLEIDVEDGEPYNGRVKSEVRGYIRVAGSSAASEGNDLDDLEATTGAAEPEPVSEPATASVEDDAEVPSVVDEESDDTVDLESVDLR